MQSIDFIFDFNFMPLGRAIKAARKKQNITRAKLAERLGLVERYVAEIENEGKIPSFQIFYTLVMMFNISVDEYFYPDTPCTKPTRQRKIEKMLDGFGEPELIIMEAAAQGICQAKETSKALVNKNKG